MRFHRKISTVHRSSLVSNLHLQRCRNRTFSIRALAILRLSLEFQIVENRVVDGIEIVSSAASLLTKTLLFVETAGGLVRFAHFEVKGNNRSRSGSLNTVPEQFVRDALTLEGGVHCDVFNLPRIGDALGAQKSAKNATFLRQQFLRYEYEP